jgi:hypothetical protein
VYSIEVKVDDYAKYNVHEGIGVTATLKCSDVAGCFIIYSFPYLVLGADK